MFHTLNKLSPDGRSAARWFLFLVFYHLLPVPWFMAVAGGLAPGSFLLAVGLAGLFNTDFDSLPIALLFLAPAIISGLLLFLLAWLLAAGIGRLKKPVARTSGLVISLVLCLGVALNPVFVTAGHSGTYWFSLLDFIDILGQWQVPPAVSISYFIGLILVLLGMLTYQIRKQAGSFQKAQPLA